MTGTMDPFGIPNSFHDPLFDAFEAGQEQPSAFHDPLADPDSLFMDDLASLLGLAEAAMIETTVVPPPFEPEPLVPAEPGAGPYLSHGPTSPGPPSPDDRPQHYRGDLQAPPAASPFLTREGLAPPSYRPHFGGAGIRNQSSSGTARWCPRDESVKDIDECRECADWDEDSGECQHELA